MKEFVIEGQKSYWGDKCSDKFRKPSADRPQAGDRGPVRVPRAACWTHLPARHGRRFRDRAAARHVDVRPAALLAALLRGTGNRDGALAGDRPAHLGGGHRAGGGASPAIRCRWRTAMCRRWWTAGVDYVWLPNDGGCRRRRRATAARRTTARGTRRCRGCCNRRRALEPHAAQVPDRPPCISSWVRRRSRRRWRRRCGGWA